MSIISNEHQHLGEPTAKEPGQADDLASVAARGLAERQGYIWIELSEPDRAHFVRRAGAVLSAAGVDRLRDELDRVRLDFANACDVGRRADARAEAAEQSLAECRSKLEKAEANYRFMVEKAADQKLDGYRERAQKCADLEKDRDEQKARADENERLYRAEDRNHAQTIRQRDAFEERINQIADALGDKSEWTNQSDRGTNALGLAVQLKARADRAEELAEKRKERAKDAESLWSELVDKYRALQDRSAALDKVVEAHTERHCTVCHDRARDSLQLGLRRVLANGGAIDSAQPAPECEVCGTTDDVVQTAHQGVRCARPHADEFRHVHAALEAARVDRAIAMGAPREAIAQPAPDARDVPDNNAWLAAELYKNCYDPQSGSNWRTGWLTLPSPEARKWKNLARWVKENVSLWLPLDARDERIRELEAERDELSVQLTSLIEETREQREAARCVAILRSRIRVACAKLRKLADIVAVAEGYRYTAADIRSVARELEGKDSPGAPVEAIGSPTGSQPASALRAGEESDAGAPSIDERVKVAARWMREHAAAWHGASELLIIADRLEGKV